MLWEPHVKVQRAGVLPDPAGAVAAPRLTQFVSSLRGPVQELQHVPDQVEGSRHEHMELPAALRLRGGAQDRDAVLDRGGALRPPPPPACSQARRRVSCHSRSGAAPSLRDVTEESSPQKTTSSGGTPRIRRHCTRRPRRTAGSRSFMQWNSRATRAGPPSPEPPSPGPTEEANHSTQAPRLSGVCAPSRWNVAPGQASARSTTWLRPGHFTS